MNRAGHRVDKAGIRVRRKIHGDVRGWRHRSDDFNVEHDLAVGTVCTAAWRVGAMIYRDRQYFRGTDFELGEIGLQVRRPKPSAEFDDADALPFARARRKTIERCHLDRRIGDR